VAAYRLPEEPAGTKDGGEADTQAGV
jgi:hypothetical protein